MANAHTLQKQPENKWGEAPCCHNMDSNRISNEELGGVLLHFWYQHESIKSQCFTPDGKILHTRVIHRSIDRSIDRSQVSSIDHSIGRWLADFCGRRSILICTLPPNMCITCIITLQCTRDSSYLAVKARCTKCSNLLVWFFTLESQRWRGNGEGAYQSTSTCKKTHTQRFVEEKQPWAHLLALSTASSCCPTRSDVVNLDSAKNELV